MSSKWDEAGSDEYLQKGGAPKGFISCRWVLGHKFKRFMTVIVRWGAIVMLLNHRLRRVGFFIAKKVGGLYGNF